MARIPVVKGRKINKIMCLVWLVIAVLFLVAGGILFLMGDPELGSVMFVLSGIVGIFVVVFGISWFVYARLEAKKQNRIENVIERHFPVEDRGEEVYQDFILPRTELIEAARMRFMKIAFALAVSSVVVFALLYGILFFTIGFGGFKHMFMVLGFCLLVTIPGSIPQYVIYRKYANAVPQKIMLYPGAMAVDQTIYSVRNIRQIWISSYFIRNFNSPALYRKLIVQTGTGTKEYPIDFRARGEDSPQWKEYVLLLQTIQVWAKHNNVKLSVDYMD